MSDNNKSYSICVSGLIAIAGNVNWQLFESPANEYNEEGLFISFPLFSEISRRSATKLIKKVVKENDITWLREDFDRWLIDLDRFFIQFSDLHANDWLKGIVEPEIEIDTSEREVFEKKRRETSVRFIITRKEVEQSMPKRIFLSHSGIDKPIVRDYYNVLKGFGFDPWLDEDAMVAGVPLERALLDGMKDSCAAVFFVTPKYKDENFLASEINYAMSQKRDKGDRFSIITLVLEDNFGNKGQVPELLKQYVWKEPFNDLLGIQEILRALPIEAKQINWKKNSF